MIDGDVNEFIDKLHYGVDLYVRYNGALYSFQGWDKDGMHTLLVLQEEPLPVRDVFQVTQNGREECVNAFLKEPLWEGKNFFEAEKNMSWVD